MKIQTTLRIALKFLPFKAMMHITGRKLVLPYYHAVTDVRLPHLCNLYSPKTQKQFESDLEFLCKHYKPISIDELYGIIMGQRSIDRPCFHLTFDDGLTEVYTNIAPVLQRLGIPSTVFVNTGFLDNKKLFYRYKASLLIEALDQASENVHPEIYQLLETRPSDRPAIRKKVLSLNYTQTNILDELAVLLNVDFEAYLSTQQPYLTSSQVIELMSKGFNIGSHSFDHPLFTNIDLPEQQLQIRSSLQTLNDKYGMEHKYFSFPFSDVGLNSEIFNWMYGKEGIKLSFGTSGLKDDTFPYHLHRIWFEDNQKEACDILKAEYLNFMIKHFFGKNKICRQH